MSARPVMPGRSGSGRPCALLALGGLVLLVASVRGQAPAPVSPYNDTEVPMQPGQIRALRNNLCLNGDQPTSLKISHCGAVVAGHFWSYDEQTHLLSIFSKQLCLVGEEKPVPTLRMAPCSASDARQKWEIEPLYGHFNVTAKIRLQGTNLCLTAPRRLNLNQVETTLEPCNPTPCKQLWRVNAWRNDAFKEWGLDPLQKKLGYHDYVDTLEGLWRTNIHLYKRPIYSKDQFGGGRILCFILTMPAKHYLAQMARETWGRHCDYFAVVSSAPDPNFDILWVADMKGMPESRQGLWHKSRTGYLRAYEDYVLTGKVDWIVRGDDDTFFLMDNVRTYLSEHDPSVPFYFGYRHDHKRTGAVPYFSGGGGSLISHAAMKAFGDYLRNHPEMAYEIFAKNAHIKGEDMAAARIFHEAGVQAIPRFDNQLRNYILFDGIENFHRRTQRSWLGRYPSDEKAWQQCCSNHWFATHYASMQTMMSLEDLHIWGCEGNGVDPVPREWPRMDSK